MRLWHSAARALAVLVLFAGALRAQQAAALSDSTLDAETRALSNELRCPVCQGLSLAASPSELAMEMRDVIKDQLREGKTPEEVRQYFIGKYGEWILLEPKPQGLNLIVYVLPVLAVLGGLLLIWRAVRKWTTPVSGNPSEFDPGAGSPDA